MVSKIGDWVYPYKVWPDDYPHEQIYTPEIIERITCKHGFTDTPEFRETLRKALTKAARDYFGYERYCGTTGASETDIKKESQAISNAAKLLRQKLSGLSQEMFEAIVFQLAEGTTDVPSYFDEYRFREDSGFSVPTLEDFYSNHEGYAKFAAMREQLLPALAALEESTGIIKNDTLFFSQIKKPGSQRRSFAEYVGQLTEFWEKHTRQQPKRYRDDESNKISGCLDFLEDAFKEIPDYRDDLPADERKRLKSNARDMLYRALDKYINSPERFVTKTNESA